MAKRFHISLPDRLHEQLDQVTREREETRSRIIADALRLYFAALETTPQPSVSLPGTKQEGPVDPFA